VNDQPKHAQLTPAKRLERVTLALIPVIMTIGCKHILVEYRRDESKAA